MSSQLPPPLVAELISEVRAFQRATHRMDEAARRQLGVNASDLRCLDVLQLREPMTAGALADETALTTGAITTLLDRLEQAGYVRRARDTGDRRRVLVELTPFAHERIGELYGPIGVEGRSWFSRYTADEVQVVVDFLRQGKEMNDRHAARVEAMPSRTVNRSSRAPSRR